MASAGDITQLLVAARAGERSAMDELFPLVYDELHGMAHGRLRRGSPGQTLNTTALVHEAYLKLVDQSRAEWNDRNHFLAVASVAMRHILVDYARRRTARKRGGEQRDVTLDDMQPGVMARAEEILALDAALGSLTKLNERLAKLVELRFFGGLSVAETSQVLEISERTVKRDWRKARAILYRTLGGNRAEGATAQ